MERIHYSGDKLLTGTDIARALLEFAGALAATGGSETIDIPFIHDDGSRGRANLLVGPASQIISETEESEFDELIDEDLVATLTSKTARLRGANMAGPAEPLLYTEDFDDL